MGCRRTTTDISRGVACGVVEPTPSCPQELEPHTNTRPSLRNTALCLPPAETWRVSTPISSIDTGSMRGDCVVPSPSWPSLLPPTPRMSPAATRALVAAAALVTFCPTPSCGRCGKAAALEATRATLANDAPTHARPIPGFFALKAADGAAEALHAITPTPVGGLAAAGPRALRPSAISSKK